MSNLLGLIMLLAVLGIVFSCVLKAENGETYEDRQQKLADKMFNKKKKAKGE